MGGLAPAECEIQVRGVPCALLQRASAASLRLDEWYRVERDDSCDGYIPSDIFGVRVLLQKLHALRFISPLVSLAIVVAAIPVTAGAAILKRQAVLSLVRTNHKAELG